MKSKQLLTLTAIFIGILIFYYFNNEINKQQENEKIVIENKTINLTYGETTKIKIANLPEDKSSKELLWSSDNPNLVTVEPDGTVIVNRNEDGYATITVTNSDGSYIATTKIAVKKAEETIHVTKIKLNSSSITLNYNKTYKLAATVSPSNATNKNVTWSSSDTSLVTVDQNGNIKAVGNRDASATITVTTSDGKHKATAKVTVKKVDTSIKVTGVKLNTSSISLNYNGTYKLAATVSPSNATNKNVTWSSSDTSLVTVDQNGNIKAVGNRDASATITVTTSDGKHKATAKVTVKKVDTTVNVTGISIDQGSKVTKYLNSKNQIKINLSASISPSNATNKKVSWSSDNANVATVNSSGTVTIKDLGVANIKVTSQNGNYTDTYKVTVKQKAIVVITASQGVRMNKWFTTYTSSKGNYYSKENGTLKYIYISGSGFDFQYGEGLTKAKEYINEKYGAKKKYVELSVFFSLTGNSVKTFTCDEINTSNEYNNIAKTYNTSIQEIKNLGYTNTKGFVISHSPLNTKHALAKEKKIVYSHKTEACQSGYRSAWKYWLSNKRMKSLIATGKYSNIKFIDTFSDFLVIKDESKRTFTWLRTFTTPADDPLHWDQPTTVSFMQLAFDNAGM